MMERGGCQQQKMIYATTEILMPRDHFLRDLVRLVDFDFVYDKVEHLYSNVGRRSIDPVVVVKMLLLGYLYGIESERRLEKEVRVNIAYRWFLGIELDEAVPDHSTLSQLRRRKFNGTTVFEEIFSEIVSKCIELGLVDGKLLLTDSTHVRANVCNDVTEKIMVDIEPSAYLRRLNEQAEQDGIMPRKRKAKGDDENDLSSPAPRQKEILKSPTDPDSGFMKRPGKPLGFYYLSHQTCDGKHGIITDVCVTPGNAHDSSVHSERVRHQIAKFGFSTKAICADSAYDSSEIYKDMLDMGIRTFIPKREPSHTEDGFFSADDFFCDENEDFMICPAGCRLKFSAYRPMTGTKRYISNKQQCEGCSLRSKCISGTAKYKTVECAYYRRASEEQYKNLQTRAYYEAMRLRKIWCEGNFSHQKSNHNLRRVPTRGLGNATMHCLLSATALNLKRMVALTKLREGTHGALLLFRQILFSTFRSMVEPMFLFFCPYLSTAPK